MRWKGRPVPYLSSPVIAEADSSYFSGPTPSGGAAVYTSPQRLQRSRSHSHTVAASGAMPVTRTSTAGSCSGYTLPLRQPWHASPPCSVACATFWRAAPVYAAAPLRPWPGRLAFSCCPASGPKGGLFPASFNTARVFSVGAPKSSLRSRAMDVPFACNSACRKASVSIAAFSLAKSSAPSAPRRPLDDGRQLHRVHFQALALLLAHRPR